MLASSRAWYLPLLGLFLCLSCTEEDRPRSVVQEPRVISAQVNPPQLSLPPAILDAPLVLAAEVQMDIEALIYDPNNVDGLMDVVMVACTEDSQLPGECLEVLQYQALGEPYANEEGVLTEAAWRDYLTRHAWRGKVELEGATGVASADLSSFEGYALYLQEYNLTYLEANISILSCPEGTCEIFAALDTYLEQGEAQGGKEILEGVAIAEYAALQGPLQTIAFAQKEYQLTSSKEYINENPTIAGVMVGGLDGLQTSEVIELVDQQTISVSVPSSSFQQICVESGACGFEAVSVAFFSTQGLLDPYAVQVSYQSGQASTYWQVTDPGETYLWVVVQDSRGGQSWAEVRAVR